MDHHHHVTPGARHSRRLAIVFALTASYLVVEIIGAWLSNSLSLLADAGHMFTDVGGLGLALLAIRFAARPATAGMTFGYYRTEILAAAINGAILFVVGGFVLYQAVRRFSDPPDVGGGAMIVIAGIGLAVNVAGALLLRCGAEESLNVEGAFLEVVADMIGSIAVIVAGGIVLATGWNYADPIFSIGIGLFIIPRTLRLMKRSVNILMEGTPEGLDFAEIQASLAADPDVLDVHELHVWSITSGVVSLSTHVLAEAECDSDAVLDRINETLATRYDIHHTTIQIERRARSEQTYHDQRPRAS